MDRGINNQNDLWHGIKNLKKKLKTVASGPLYKRNVTWSLELEDKVDAVAKHVYWASQNCDYNPETFKDYIDNMVFHFANDHGKCHASARCQLDPNYEPSKIVITCEKAKKLFLSVLHGSTIYKNYSNFSGAMETHYVESYNNVINVFQDKAFHLQTGNTTSGLVWQPYTGMRM